MNLTSKQNQREKKNQTKKGHVRMQFHSVYTKKIEKTNLSYCKSE